MKLEVGKRYHIKPVEDIKPLLPEGNYEISAVTAGGQWFDTKERPNCSGTPSYLLACYTFTPLTFKPGDLVDVKHKLGEPWPSYVAAKVFYADSKGVLVQGHLWCGFDSYSVKLHTIPQLEIGQIYKAGNHVGKLLRVDDGIAEITSKLDGTSPEWGIPITETFIKLQEAK